jgi:hypothetical protein
LTIKGVAIYNYELVRFHQFSWIIDTLSNSKKHFAYQLTKNLYSFASTTASLIFPASLLCIFYLIQTLSNSVSNSVSGLKREVFLVYGTLFIIILLFFALLGYYADRLTFSAAIVIISFTQVAVNAQKLKPWVSYLLSMIVWCWHIFLLMFEMPHFSDRIYY